MKAYALVSAERPELRRCFLRLPRPCLYEHAYSVATLGIEREYESEPCVFFARIMRPEIRRLADLDADIQHHKTAPVESIASFRQLLWLGRLPAPVRRLAWCLGLNAHGAKRGVWFGTFSVSTVASLGAAGLHILSPLTTTISFGAFDTQGNIDVRLAYDHRVLDGASVARALAALEETLLGPIAGELRSLASPAAASATQAQHAA